MVTLLDTTQMVKQPETNKMVKKMDTTQMVTQIGHHSGGHTTETSHEWYNNITGTPFEWCPSYVTICEVSQLCEHLSGVPVV